MFLQELFITEGPQTVAFCWGRFQPPHRAHGELFNTLKNVGNFDYWICASQTQGPKDPLDYSTKMKFIKLQHPKLASHVLEDPAIKTVYQAVVAIYNKYDPNVAERLTLVFVGDKTRVAQFVPGFQKFNGVEGKHGYYKFGMITGHETARDADSETDASVTDPNQDMSKLNPANISGSLVRNLAASGDFDKFKFTVSKTGNEPWVNDLFAALGGKQKAVDEDVNEGPSLPSTLKSIATNGEPIAQLYERLKSMAKRWVENNGSLKGYHRNAAGQSAQWFNNFYFNKLQADLYSLVKQAPKAAPPLIAYLKDASEDRDTKINFTEISRSLPPVLFGIGRKIGDESLMRFAKNWNTRREDYENYLSRLEAEANGDDDSGIPSTTKQPKSDAPGKQRSQAEEIVNSVLSKLPKKVAGEIRNAIARAPNKLQALHQELAKRNIQGVAEVSDNFRNRERNVGVEHERNNYAVYINGKPWKVFADPQQAMNIAKSLKMKGKDAKVYPTGANPSESIEEATKKPNATTRHLRDYPVSDKDMAKPVKKPEKKKPEQGVSENEKRCPQCGMIGCKCPPGKCGCKPIKGWIPNKGFQKAKEVAEEKISVPVTQKPRQGPLRPQTGGGKHRDKKKEQKQGQQKHKQKVVDLGESWERELSKAVSKLIR